MPKQYTESPCKGERHPGTAKPDRANRPLHDGRSYFLLSADRTESADPKESASPACCCVTDLESIYRPWKATLKGGAISLWKPQEQRAHRHQDFLFSLQSWQPSMKVEKVILRNWKSVPLEVTEQPSTNLDKPLLFASTSLLWIRGGTWGAPPPFPELLDPGVHVLGE